MSSPSTKSFPDLVPSRGSFAKSVQQVQRGRPNLFLLFMWRRINRDITTASKLSLDGEFVRFPPFVTSFALFSRATQQGKACHTYVYLHVPLRVHQNKSWTLIRGKPERKLHEHNKLPLPPACATVTRALKCVIWRFCYAIPLFL